MVDLVGCGVFAWVAAAVVGGVVGVLALHLAVADPAEDQALEQATSRARDDAAVMAKASGAHLGNLLYVTNQIATSVHVNALANYSNGVLSDERARSAAPPLAIEPHKVIREATVYAVFAIE